MDDNGALLLAEAILRQARHDFVKTTNPERKLEVAKFYSSKWFKILAMTGEPINPVKVLDKVSKMTVSEAKRRKVS